MPDDNRHNNDDKNPRKGGDFKVPPRTWVVWIDIIGGIIMLVMFKNRMEMQPGSLSPHAFLAKLDGNLIAQASVDHNPQSQDVAEIREGVGTESALAGPHALQTGVAVAVVGGALLRIAQDAVGFGGLFELVLGGGIVGVAVRMKLKSLLAVGALDLLLARVPAYT